MNLGNGCAFVASNPWSALDPMGKTSWWKIWHSDFFMYEGALATLDGAEDGASYLENAVEHALGDTIDATGDVIGAACDVSGGFIQNEGYDATIWVLGKTWASPYTVAGITFGFGGYLIAGGPFSKVYINIGNNAIQFNDLPSFGRNLAPGTFGNVILYWGSNETRYGETYESSERWEQWYQRYRNNEPCGPEPIRQAVPVGKHENGHTHQYEVFGPFFMPLYLLEGGPQASNPFERSADEWALGTGTWAPW